MTTPIAPGDLVLRNGRAEIVGDVWRIRYRPEDWLRQAGVGLTTLFPLISDATRIGAVSDGWRIHTGSERPEGVGAKDRVEIAENRLDGSVWISDPRKADGWSEPVVAYRIVQRAERPSYGGLAAFAENLLNMNERPADPTPDLRAAAADVALELRDYVSGLLDGDDFTGCVGDIRRMANRLDPPKPEPLKVGDAVTGMSEDDEIVSGHIVILRGRWAMVEHAEDVEVCSVALIAKLERIP